MTTQELDALQALCDGATPGPWDSTLTFRDRYYIKTPSYGVRDFCCLTGDLERKVDADFIAASRTALPELIAEVRRLQHYEDWARRIAKLPCCNDCADAKTCEKKPKWGEVCAINCPIWRGLDGKENK